MVFAHTSVAHGSQVLLAFSSGSACLLPYKTILSANMLAHGLIMNEKHALKALRAIHKPLLLPTRNHNTGSGNTQPEKSPTSESVEDGVHAQPDQNANKEPQHGQPEYKTRKVSNGEPQRGQPEYKNREIANERIG